MATSTITQLLEDAELVALYGQRSGKLMDIKLATAIQRAHQAQPNFEWGSDAAVDLQVALSEAIRVIEPVTLVDLHKWNPFDGGSDTSERRSNMTRVGFVTVAVLLMLLCGYYTVWYKTANQLLASIAATAAEQQGLATNETVFSMVGNKDGTSEIDKKNINSLFNSSIRQKYIKIQEIEKEANQNFDNYYKINMYLFPIIPAYYYTKQMFIAEQDQNKPSLGASLCGPKATQYLMMKAALRPDDKTHGTVEEKAPDNTPSLTTIPDKDEDLGVSELKNSVERNQRISESIRCILGISAGPQVNQLQVNVDSLKMKIEVVGIWILPGLYGALGAMMFFMRWFLNQMRPNPGFGRVVLRVSLSTFAGIAVGWFWSPSLSENFAPKELGLGVLAIAFLVGFSIDVFFALLDRMVIVANSAINRIGPLPADKSTR